MSEPKEIPAAMLDAATEAIAATQYCSRWGAGKLAEVALNAARVPELLARIAKLEREVVFRKEAWDGADSHVTELQARIAELESALTGMVYQFAIYSDNGFITAGLSALEEAFDALDWAQPHRDPRVECDKNGCTKHVSVIDHGKWCGDHKPKCAESAGGK